MVDVGPVRSAYSSFSRRYIELFGGEIPADDVDAMFVGEHLAEAKGPVLDLGCGPGQWTGYLHSLGCDVTGVDIVPEFIEHARAAHPGVRFRLGSMNEAHPADPPLAAILSWYSTIHVNRTR